MGRGRGVVQHLGKLFEQFPGDLRITLHE
jgi:hypothetical protein